MHVSVVLDRSGSMESLGSDTIGGFNTFLNDQKGGIGKCTFSMVQFDTEYEVLHTFKEIKDISDLTDRTFMPRGMTALLDAIGRAVVTAGEELSKMKEEDRPGKVLFVIITDGMENSSREYTHEKISEMIKHQEEIYKWKFVFLAANQDAILTGASIGIQCGNTLSFAATDVGVSTVYNTVSSKLKNFRDLTSEMYSSVDTFTVEDRKEQDELINKK